MQYKAVLLSCCVLCTAIRGESFCSIASPYAFQLGCGVVIDSRVLTYNYGCSKKPIFPVLLVHLYTVNGTLLGSLFSSLYCTVELILGRT